MLNVTIHFFFQKKNFYVQTPKTLEVLTQITRQIVIFISLIIK